MTFIELAKTVLERSNTPMTPKEIWDYAVNNKIEISTKGKTPWASIGAQLYVDIRNNKETKFAQFGVNPVKFFLIGKPINGPKYTNEEIDDDYKERELHPFLTYYANCFMKAYTKTVYHEKSSKKNYNKWLHPDLVGVHFPIEDMQTDVLDFGLSTGNQMIKLYSFELKKQLDFSNLRESYFRAVSNSSWANEGYLVAATISESKEFRYELGRLTSAFGIGIIELNIEDPDASVIKFPAKYKQELDWETMNKLAKENPDFREFMKRVKNDLSNKEIWKDKYDKLYDVDDLLTSSPRLKLGDSNHC